MFLLTKKEVMEAALRGEGALGKAADDEPVFVLRAQDCEAADLVELWAIRAQSMGTDGDKTKQANEIAEYMRRWPVRKVPD